MDGDETVARPGTQSRKPAVGSGDLQSPNRLSPMRFVIGFGIVALLDDFVYEGARSVSMRARGQW
jgi:hypothetical protein